MKDERKFTKRQINAVLRIIKFYRTVTLEKIKKSLKYNYHGIGVKDDIGPEPGIGTCYTCIVCVAANRDKHDCYKCVLKINGVECTNQSKYRAMYKAKTPKSIARAFINRANFIEKSLIKRGII